MGRRRYITSDISTDPKVAELAEYGALPLLLYTWAIAHLDDWGRMTGDARQFKLLVCPALDVTTAEVDEALDQIASVGLWERYEVNGKKYIAVPEEAWYRHQSYINKEKRNVDKSQYPAPPSKTRAEEQQATTQNSADCRTSPQNAEEERSSALNSEEERKTAQNSVSPSPSPSPSRDQDHRRRCHHAHAREEVAVTVEPQEDERPDARPMESPPELDAKLGEVARTYEQEIGVLSAMVQQELVKLVDEYPAHWIRDAIRQAAIQNVRKLSYVRSILANWRTEGRSARGHPSVRQDVQTTETRKRRKRGAEHGASGGRSGEDAYWDELERAYFGS